MALLDLGSPPTIEAKHHTDYRPWLEHRCFDQACVYCLEDRRVIQVDHVEPESLAPERVCDPTNLLPSCGVCNGVTGKWDYHPRKKPRLRCPKDTHGYLALDPRVDDYARMYEVEGDGSLRERPGEGCERALWNREILFRLNRKKLRQWRELTLNIAATAEHFVEMVTSQGEAPNPETLRSRDTMVQVLAQRLLFFELFEIELSPTLHKLANDARDRLREPPLATK